MYDSVADEHKMYRDVALNCESVAQVCKAVAQRTRQHFGDHCRDQRERKDRKKITLFSNHKGSLLLRSPQVYVFPLPNTIKSTWAPLVSFVAAVWGAAAKLMSVNCFMHCPGIWSADSVSHFAA